MLALVKLVDPSGFVQIFVKYFARLKRTAKLGHYRMVLSLLLLLFVGFQRLKHFIHVRTEPMICGTLRVSCLPVVSTFWRYLASLRLSQAASLLKLPVGLCGTQRRRATMSNRDVARQILQFRALSPDVVKSVHVKGHGEFKRLLAVPSNRFQS